MVKDSLQIPRRELNKGVTVKMMNRANESNHGIVEGESGIGVPSYKSNPLSIAWVACTLLLLVHFMIIGCGTLMTDPQSGIPYGDSPVDSRPEKVWPVERTLVSNEVNCIAADSDNVWIATALGVSRWDRQQDKWLHYTMEDGLANDMVNAVAIDGQWVWFATDEGVCLLYTSPSPRDRTRSRMPSSA